jgi:hypothetical protein
MTPSRHYGDVAIALLLFAFHLLVYSRTLPPGLAYGVDALNPPGDTHEFTMAIAELRLTRRTGYPIYTWLGFLFTRAFPFGELAYRTNLMSAVFGAAGVAVIFVIGRRVGLRRAFAALAAVAFGITTTFWSQAVITEVYTLNVLALALVIWLLLRWSDLRSTAAFVQFALAYGISLGCHMSNLALGAVFGLFVLGKDPAILRNPRALSLGLLAFLAGISQYAWVPLMADTAPFPNPRPDSLFGCYKYTIGAFSNLRFAYPLDALPGRFLRYLGLLDDNFSWFGIAVGALGTWALLRRQPAHFWLLFGVFAVNVAMAMQVYATDVEVFFLPSYVAWAIFLGFGAEALWRALAAASERSGASSALVRRMPQLALLLVLVGWTALIGKTSFAANDRSADTVFEDFYATVFSILPPGSFLTPGPGVFGQGAVYFQKVLGRRPDVTVHAQPTRLKMPPQPVFSVLPLVDGRARAPFSPTPFPPNAWLIPVLLTSNQRSLTLYRVDRHPPTLKVGPPAADNRRPGGPTELLHATVDVVSEPPRPRLRLVLQWQVAGRGRHTVLTRVDGAVIDTRPLGLGNLGRYGREVEPLGDDPLSEVYDLVLPRSVGRGTHTLELGLLDVVAGQVRHSWFEPETFSIE